MYRGSSSGYRPRGDGARQNPQNRPLIRSSSATAGQIPRSTSPPRYHSGRPDGFQQQGRSPSRSATTNSHSGSNSSNRGQNPYGSFTRRINPRINFQEEIKVRIYGVQQRYSTYEVYNAMRKYGYILRIDLVTGSFDTAAYVLFEPPLSESLWNGSVFIGGDQVKVEPVPKPPNLPSRSRMAKTIFANSVDFGLQIGETTMVAMHSVNAPSKVRVFLNMERKEINIQFPLMIDDRKQYYRFRLPLAQIDRVHLADNDGSGQGLLVIPFKFPPQFFRRAKQADMHRTFSPSDKIWSETNSWYRITDIVDAQTEDRKTNLPIMNRKEDVVIDIGRWTTYRLSFNASTLKEAQFQEFQGALADHGITITNSSPFSVENKFAAPIWDVLEEEFASTHPHLEPSSSQSVLDELLTNKINLNFSVRYQLDVCISNGYLKEHNITRPFLERLASMIPIEAVDILETIASKQDVCYDPMAILDVPVKVNIKKNIPSYCVLSRSATITPTTIHVASPLVETSNRIIRKHAADSDRFIRIKFSDEKTEGRIHSQSNGCSEAVFERIKQALKNGIVVAGRYYAFLAFGNSQFRDHGAYFYAPTGSHSADTIRLSMGSFQHIKSVAKFGARLGQCFSTTRPITSISCEIQRIPDIERNGFTFTDGVGKLSSLLAQMAAKELGLQNSFEDPPSLFQFRLAGCKGVLAIDPTLMGKVVCIRPSQYKFKAENLGLEIIRSSTFATACLNRQLIIVLSTLGVSDLTFLRKQQEMVNDLEKATKEETFALGKLQSIIDFNQTTLTMATMILDGFMATKDPFIMSLLQLWRAFHIKYLKEKARINIEKGAFVLGCIDETATLRGHYNNPQSRPDTTREQKLATLPEIFLQISDPSKKGYYKVIEGTCILARNPSLHAGDIRIVRAVDNSALRHLKNAVVLPQTGDRDIANMCSGGDLDGDDYLVMWDADLLPEIINEVPMDFTPEKPLESNEPITIESVIDFFVTYMKNDSLPRIALAHLAQADFNNGGVRDNKCLELARLHSQAVDYPKSGIPAMMDRNLLPRKYPHFMESKYRPAERTYKSTNVLGMLYDQVGLVNFKPQYENPFDNRILDAFELDYEILGQASSLKDSYDTALRRLMAKHDIRTEFEAWSVFVLSHNQESRDYTFAEDFGISIGNLKKQYRNLVREASGATSSTGGFVKLEPFIAAMYTVTAREMEKALIECQTLTTIEGQQVPMRKMDPENMPFISFPWLFVHELGRIATKGPTSRSVPLVEQAGQRLESHKAYSDVDDRKNPDQLTAPDSGSEVVHTPSPSDGSESRSLETQDTLRIDRVGRSKVSAFDRLSLLGLD